MGTRVFLFFVVAAAQAFASGARKKPIVYDITRIAMQPSSADALPGDLRIAGGKTLPLDMTWAPGTKILFEDLMPGANWEHPAVYRVVAADGRVLKEIKATRPPVELDSALPLDALVGAREDVKFQINDYKGIYKVKEPSKFHAVLINGNADLRHWNDYSFLYRVLTQVYGYLPSQIHVADTAFRERRPDLDGDGKADILYGSTVKEVRELLVKVKGLIHAEDHLLIAVNDHGSQTAGESTIILNDGEMKASELSALLKGIATDKVLGIFEQCFGGGFVRPTIAGKRVAMSASSNSEYSWATEDLNFDEFIYHVISAFAGQTHDGKTISADKNADGKISAQEAFAYAIGSDTQPESPLLEASTNAGSTPNIGVSF